MDFSNSQRDHSIWRNEARKLLQEGIFDDAATCSDFLIQRIAKLLQLEAEMTFAANSRTDEVMQSAIYGLEIDIASKYTAEELIALHRDVCGALVCAAREKCAFNAVEGETLSVNNAIITAQISEWLLHSCQQQLLSLVHDGRKPN